MEKKITEKDIDKIVETYPNPRVVVPAVVFEEQLKKHLKSYFEFKIEEKLEVKEDGKDKNRK